ncbi:TniB family NTP-binding protein [Shewanella spartinae]|uniref:TniB family NTP-binding protein n=1 Tax=Shewanella spartinae TaxID=2864205 RepID=UPI001C662034|nr:TniB family NTP-binding protein [Shewanella spartinae]QYJ95703.1 TniB family NTP-binding protein [Shewanella spartinae]
MGLNNHGLAHMEMPLTMASHPTLKAAWKAMNHVHYNFRQHEKAFGLLITGPSGIGKSFLAETYTNQSVPKKTIELNTIPVLHFEVPIATNSPGILLRSLIKAMGAPVPRKTVEFSELFAQFNYLLKAFEVELLILDEVQHTLPKRDGIKTQEMLKFFASLLDQSRVPTVFMGTRAAERLMNFGKSKGTYDDDEQLSRRLIKPIKLHEILPRNIECFEAFNFFFAKANLPLLAQDEKDIIARLCLAYRNHYFGTLDKLFSGYDFSYVTDRKSLLNALKKSFELNCPQEDNPFCTKAFSATDANSMMEHHREQVLDWRHDNGY